MVDVAIPTGVPGFDFGRQRGGSEPWSPNPRKRVGNNNKRQQNVCTRRLIEATVAGPLLDGIVSAAN
jgi:hypothetical protein